MLRPRAQFLATVFGTITAVILERPCRAAFKAIFDVTVQDYWKDSASPFLQAHAGSWGAAMLEWLSPFQAGALTTLAVVFAVEMFFARRRRRATATTSSQLASPLELLDPTRQVYVGSMHIEMDALAEDLWVAISLRGYNASSYSLSVEGVQGFIKCARVVDASVVFLDNEPLPTPRVMSERAKVDSIPKLTEFIIVLEQRVPRSVATSITNAIAQGEQIQFYLDDLEISSALWAQQTLKFDLDTWNGIAIRPMKDFVFMGRIITAHMDARSSTSDTLG